MTSGVGPGKLWTLRFLPSAVNHCDLFSTSAFLSILTDKYSFWQYDIDYPSQMSSVLLRKWSLSQPLFSLVSMGERPLRDGTWQRLRLVTEGQTNKLDTEYSDVMTGQMTRLNVVFCEAREWLAEVIQKLSFIFLGEISNCQQTSMYSQDPVWKQVCSDFVQSGIWLMADWLLVLALPAYLNWLQHMQQKIISSLMKPKYFLFLFLLGFSRLSLTVSSIDESDVASYVVERRSSASDLFLVNTTNVRQCESSGWCKNFGTAYAAGGANSCGCGCDINFPSFLPSSRKCLKGNQLPANFGGDYSINAMVKAFSHIS